MLLVGKSCAQKEKVQTECPDSSHKCLQNGNGTYNEIRWLSSVVHGHFYIYKLQSLDKSFRRWQQNGGSDKYFCPMTTWPIVTILGHWVTLQFNFLKTAMLIVTIAVWSIPIKRGILILKLLPEFYRRGEIRSFFFILKNLLYSHTCKK